MAEIVVLIVVGAAIVALGLWVFSHLGGVVLVLVGIVVLGFGLYVGAQLLMGLGAIFDRIGAWMRRQSYVGDTHAERPAVSGPPPPSPEDDLVKSLKRFRTDLAGIEGRLRSETREELQDDYARIAQAQKFVKETGLDSALPNILKEVCHWPAWTKRPDAQKVVRADALGFTDVQAEEVRKDKAVLTRVAFVFRERKYLFEFEQSPGYMGSSHGTIRLFDAEELVISIGVYQSGSGGWSFSSVEALKPAGEWVAAVVEIEHNIRLKEQAFRASLERERVRQTAAGLPPTQSTHTAD
jgi:hypothetical protein